MINARIQAKIAAVIGRRRSERRRARRLSPVRLTPCMIRADAASEELPGWVHNLSVCGAGLLCARPFEPETSITVLFINAAHTFALSASFHVIRCYRVVNGDYFLGGQFTQPLRYDELLPFMV
jgi:hypothetical protein